MDNVQYIFIYSMRMAELFPPPVLVALVLQANAERHFRRERGLKWF